MSVTLRQKELVQDTCEQLAPDSETAARLFYDRLFAMNPQLRALFPAENGKSRSWGRKPSPPRSGKPGLPSTLC